MEMITAALLGWIVDVVFMTEPGRIFSEQLGFMLAAMIFILLVRPATFMLSAYMQSVAIGPTPRSMVLTRLHRWTLGYSTQFFENDFAGRIAQKEMQGARALTDVVVDFLHTVLFALSSIVAALVIVASIGRCVGTIVGLWILGFYGLLRYFLPRIRQRAARRANVQAVTTRQVIDTISNISIVKLFSNTFYEDCAALKIFE